MKIRESILKLGKYSPPLEGRNPENYLLLDFNESPLPPPPHVIEALVHFIQSDQLGIYPSYGDILKILANYVKVEPENLILTNGSDQAIDIILRALLNEGDDMVMAKPGFAMFFQVAGTLGVHCISPEYRKDMSFPYEEILESVTPQSRLIVIINPNNPTGTSAKLEQIETLLKSFPDIAVLVDEAYFEFTEETCVSLLSNYDNLIIIRTFSKALAIPSLRLGYAIAHTSFIDHLYKIRGPYDVNMLSIIAAKAQLTDSNGWRERTHEIMKIAKPALELFFNNNQVKYYKGDANFMLIEPNNVEEAIEVLKQNKILVRPMKPPISQTFRLSVSILKDCQTFMNVYKNYLEQCH